jgi:hypothetical protein
MVIIMAAAAANGPMISGVLLCIYPYAIESLLWLSIIGIALVAAPF